MSAQTGSYLNLLNPQGTWSGSIQYLAQVVFGSTSTLGTNAALFVACPTVTGPDNKIYYATGYDSVSGLPSQPTLGTAPASDTAWTLLGS